MQDISINDPRVPAGWRSNPAIQAQLRTTHKLCWDVDTLVLESLQPDGQSYSLDRPGHKYESLSPSPVASTMRPTAPSKPAPAPRTIKSAGVIPKIPRSTLEKSLLSHFKLHTLGGTVCKPLNKWHRQGQAFLCGYASVWDTLATNANRDVIRKGAFRAALQSGEHTEVWIVHRDEFKLGSTADGSLLMFEDDYGLACFLSPQGPHAAALTGLIRRGQIGGMSIALRPSVFDTLSVNGNYCREHLELASLPEVSFASNPYNPATICLAVNASSDDYSFHDDISRQRLLQQLEA